MAGYSGTPLPRKLGVKPGHLVLALDAPDGLDLGEPEAEVHRAPGEGPYDVILVFCPASTALHDTFPTAKALLARNGGLWICWPKRASKVPTDLSENPIREYGLDLGLVDNKVAAIDATWSGLRFVYRVADR
ncbi:hypothetical protein SAMN05444920_13430 [Nonomuraea solani]|uniref:DUF3052 domain-containing protein n=1 Tax=Nonomuraea solani TaxID=1144553 RepID=A0A1H6F250_9ACTN|nr:DUF3052 domain-containing protein [Nonomuraea solani]SEH03226.1 hypothetical protein SAMN05444920_13430 [Nonomuraea solani]